MTRTHFKKKETRKRRRELFDIVSKHLLGQMELSQNVGACRYRKHKQSGDTIRCAVGAIIPDDMYEFGMEGKNIAVLLSKFPSLRYTWGVNIENELDRDNILWPLKIPTEFNKLTPWWKIGSTVESQLTLQMLMELQECHDYSLCRDWKHNLDRIEEDFLTCYGL